MRSLERVGFTTERAAPKRRALLSICGREKQGKTHFALTAPGPIALIDMDIGTEGVIEKFTDKEIYYLDFKPPEDKVLAETDWERLVEGVTTVLEHDEIRTLIWDTATEGWELLRMARFGKLSQVMPHQYGPVNAEWRRLIRKAYDSDVNLILLHKMKKKYVNDKWNGTYERSGFADIGFLAQCNAEVSRDTETGEFRCHVIDSRQNPDLANVDLEGPMCNFETLLDLVFS